MSYLTNILTFEGENIPGLVTISIARARDVLTFPDTFDGVAVQELAFKPGKDFIRWIATYKTASFSARSSDTPEGTSKSQELPFVLPKNSDIEPMLLKAESDEFIILVEDANGFRYLYGTPDKPVRFSFDKKSGSGADRNQYDCLFFSESTDNKIIYPHTFGAEIDFTSVPPVIIRRGSIDGPVLTIAPSGSTVVIISPYSFGYQLYIE